MRTSEHTEALQRALVAAQAELPVVAPELDNPYYSSKYADFTALKKTCDPILNRHGLAVIHGCTMDAGIQVVDVEYSADGELKKSAQLFAMLKCTARLCHEDGGWIEVDFSTPVPKPDPQKMGGALTYVKRYTYAMLVGAAVGEPDDDGNTASNKTTDVTKPSEALDEALKGL